MADNKSPVAFSAQDTKPPEEADNTAEHVQSQGGVDAANGHSAIDDNGMTVFSNSVHLEAKLEVMDNHLKRILHSADVLEVNPNDVSAFKENLQSTIAEMRTQLINMEFTNTPASLETAGQFFRVAKMEEYLESKDSAKGEESTEIVQSPSAVNLLVC